MSETIEPCKEVWIRTTIEPGNTEVSNRTTIEVHLMVGNERMDVTAILNNLGNLIVDRFRIMTAEHAESHHREEIMQPLELRILPHIDKMT